MGEKNIGVYEHAIICIQSTQNNSTGVNLKN